MAESEIGRQSVERSRPEFWMSPHRGAGDLYLAVAVDQVPAAITWAWTVLAPFHIQDDITALNASLPKKSRPLVMSSRRGNFSFPRPGFRIQPERTTICRRPAARCGSGSGRRVPLLDARTLPWTMIFSRRANRPTARRRRRSRSLPPGRAGT